MFVLPVIAGLLASPVATAPPASGDRERPLQRARGLLNEQEPLAAAEYAEQAAARAELPARERLQLALFAQSTYAAIYRPDADGPPGDPMYLCRAVAALQRSRGLAVEPEAAQRHERLVGKWRGILQAEHPTLQCPGEAPQHAAGSPPMPGAQVGDPGGVSPASARTSGGSATDSAASIGAAADAMPSAAAGAVPAIVAADRAQGAPAPFGPTPGRRPSVAPRPIDERRVAPLLISGGVSVGLGLGTLAVMTGALIVREQARVAISRFAPMVHQGSVPPGVGAELDAKEGVFQVSQRVAIATGVVGSVMALTGSALIGRGYALRRRMHVAPSVGRGEAGLTLFGRF